MDRHLSKGILLVDVIHNSRKQHQKLHLATAHLLGKSQGLWHGRNRAFLCCQGCAAPAERYRAPWTLSQVEGGSWLVGKV